MLRPPMHETEPGSENPAGPVHSNVGEAASVVTQKCVVSPRQIGVRPVTLHVGVEQFTSAEAVSTVDETPWSTQLLNSAPLAVTLFAMATRHSVSVAERLIVSEWPGFC